MTRSCWDPQQYRRFSDQRRRPAQDLIARIPLPTVRTIVDLGCGDGPVTALLAERWPSAPIVGVDSSPAMLEKAQRVCPTAQFIEGDIAQWRPPALVDLIFANAALQWVDNHERLIPDLFRHVSSGGALAVQMPANFNAPSHQQLAALVKEAEWRNRLGALLRPGPVASLSQYIEWLRPGSDAIDAWETTDMLMLDGPNAVLEWMKGTALRPFLTALSPTDAQTFQVELANRLNQAYPPEPDGRTLYPFTRRYFVAVRESGTVPSQKAT